MPDKGDSEKGPTRTDLDATQIVFAKKGVGDREDKSTLFEGRRGERSRKKKETRYGGMSKKG